jgi:hypothetical protein
MDLLPSLEVGAEAGNRYGKYTMEGVGIMIPIFPPISRKNRRSTVILRPNYWLGARSSWEIDAWGKLKNKKLLPRRNIWLLQKDCDYFR